MKNILQFIFTCCVFSSFAQKAQKETNDQVWKPFIQAYNDRDTDGFMALHSKDAVRSPRDSKIVWNWNEYQDELKEGNERGKTSGSKQVLELRFTERISNGDLAFDVGIFKVTTTRADGQIQHFYGRFHVALRKENGRWKILVDTDSSEGKTINEQHFLNAQPLE